MLLGGVDVGTTHTKAGVYRVDGVPVAECEAVTPGDAAELCGTALRLLRECVEAAGRPPAAIGVCGMAETGVPLDSGGAPVGEMLHWRDTRARREAYELAASAGEAAFFATTGLRPSAKLPLARWMWLRRHAPDRLRRMDRWANAPDLVVAALTGAAVTGPTLAARMGAYDIRRGAYDPGLLGLAGLTADRMPPVGPGGSAGSVTGAAAASTGALAGTPVIAAGHDHLAAAWAAGVRESGQVADSMGTAEAVVSPIAGPPPESARATGISVGPFVDGRSFCLVGGLSSSGGLVEWFLDRFAPPGAGDRLRWFTDLVGPPEGRPTGIVVQPYLNGRACPEPDPYRTLSLHGLRPEHTTADIGRAVLEGLCMHVRWILETQAEIAGRTPGSVTVFGGPTANPTWMWIKAQVIAVPVRVLSGCAALGAAQLAGRAIGAAQPPPAAPSQDAPSPDPGWETTYRSRFLPMARLPQSEETP